VLRRRLHHRITRENRSVLFCCDQQRRSRKYLCTHLIPQNSIIIIIVDSDHHTSCTPQLHFHMCSLISHTKDPISPTICVAHTHLNTHTHIQLIRMFQCCSWYLQNRTLGLFWSLVYVQSRTITISHQANYLIKCLINILLQFGRCLHE